MTFNHKLNSTERPNLIVCFFLLSVNFSLFRLLQNPTVSFSHLHWGYDFQRLNFGWFLGRNRHCSRCGEGEKSARGETSVEEVLKEMETHEKLVGLNGGEDTTPRVIVIAHNFNRSSMRWDPRLIKELIEKSAKTLPSSRPHLLALELSFMELNQHNKKQQQRSMPMKLLLLAMEIAFFKLREVREREKRAISVRAGFYHKLARSTHSSRC